MSQTLATMQRNCGCKAAILTSNQGNCISKKVRQSVMCGDMRTSSCVRAVTGNMDVRLLGVFEGRCAWALQVCRVWSRGVALHQMPKASLVTKI